MSAVVDRLPHFVNAAGGIVIAARAVHGAYRHAAPPAPGIHRVPTTPEENAIAKVGRFILVPADAHATRLYAFVEHVKDCKSAEEVKSRCAALLAGR